ncbi:MAG: right-handed parallel beta-helix repeat-containing protein [Victivallales bacterium]|jgi:hypothetical protein
MTIFKYMRIASLALVAIMTVAGFAALADELKIEAVPSFISCSIYLRGLDKEEQSPSVKYRKTGSDTWLDSYPLVYDKAGKEYRGSVVNLEEDSEYELRVAGKKGVAAAAKFRTWTSSPKIAKTLSVDTMLASTGGRLTITEKGSEDAWIKYTAPKGFALKAAPGGGPAVYLKGAKYIILENLTVSGGDRDAVHVQECENIRIANCDISGWGRIGVQDFHKDGKYYLPNEKKCINNDAGVNIDRSLNVVVERCYIHDPRNRANSWKFSHPAGPNAVFVRSLGGTVLRYNDFIGSDPNRWNDVVEGCDNGFKDGGFLRDADIYGNMLVFGNDDGIELDGGQMNVRFFRNKIEGCYCGVSTAPCLLGPSYIFQNLIVNLSDDSGAGGMAIKNNYGEHGAGQIFYFNNTSVAPNGFTSYGPGSISPFAGDLKGTMRGNILVCNDEPVFPDVFKWRNDFEGDLFFSYRKEINSALQSNLASLGLERKGIFEKPNFRDASYGNYCLTKGSPGSGARMAVQGFTSASSNGRPLDAGAFENSDSSPVPFRPLPVTSDRQQLNFMPGTDASFASQQIMLKCSDANFAGKFSICKNTAFGWLEIEPSEGEISKGAQVKLKVKIRPEKLEGAWIHRGAFLVRFEDGLSRPVTVYVNPETPPNVKIRRDDGVLMRAANCTGFTYQKMTDKDNPDGFIYLSSRDGKAAPDEKGLLFEFNLEKEGDCMIFARVKSEPPVGSHDSFFISVDGSKAERADLRSSAEWSWVCVSRIKESSFELLKLAAGKHSIRLTPREPIMVDSIFVTDKYSGIINPRGY